MKSPERCPSQNRSRLTFAAPNQDTSGFRRPPAREIRSGQVARRVELRSGLSKTRFTTCGHPPGRRVSARLSSPFREDDRLPLFFFGSRMAMINLNLHSQRATNLIPRDWWPPLDKRRLSAAKVIRFACRGLKHRRHNRYAGGVPRPAKAETLLH